MLRMSLPALVLGFGAALPAAAGQFEIVGQGQARAAIVVAEDAPAPVRGACKEMQACIREASGAVLEIVAARPEALAGIHVGRSPYVDGLKLDLAGLDDDGFVIAFPDARNMVILGPTDWGTEFGACEFLERYVGVRWLMPGPDGTDVPPSATITADGKPVRQEPAFFSRLMSGFRGAAQATWARRNRMHGRVSFHHNLRVLFPWKTYAETHPEFYPMIDGKRLVPTHDEGWQPCFTAPGIVDEAVKNIVAYFDKHPEATSYSLGMNDNRNFCQCADCVARISGRQNFIDRVDYSDLYYDWANRVIEGVLKKHPDKFFGCLAYSNLAAPPAKVDLHPRMIPFMTYDRHKWIDTEIRETGQRLTIEWGRKSPTLGWYDYIYGRPYALPRVWFHHMADYYRWGHAQGVRAMYAEAYPNWGEGPKLYLAFKLQWNPSLDVDRVLGEWYERLAGPAAAPLVAKYFAHWEDFWTRRILASPWFVKLGQYLPFNRDPGYLLEVSDEELAECRRQLQTALARTKTDRQKARVHVLLDAFDYYECSAETYRAGRVASEPPASEPEALAMLERAARGLAAAEKRRHLLDSVLPEHPLLANITERPLPIGQPGMDSLLQVYDWNGQRPGAVRDRLQALAQEHRGTELAQAIELLTATAGQSDPAAQQLRNGGFEEGVEKREGAKDRPPPGWSRWVRTGTAAQVEWTPEAACSGKLGLAIRGATAASVMQSVRVEPGQTYLASAMLTGRSGPKAGAGLVVKWKDKAGKWLIGKDAHAQPLQPGQTDRWTRRSVLATVPEGAGWAVVMLSASAQDPDDWVCFDDVELKQLRRP